VTESVSIATFFLQSTHLNCSPFIDLDYMVCIDMTRKNYLDINIAIRT
jgi:hypothetical protein